jgi:hypothetical protein
MALVAELLDIFHRSVLQNVDDAIGQAVIGPFRVHLGSGLAPKRVRG